MNSLILVINPGSSSIKFGLFMNKGLTTVELCRGAVEGIGSAAAFNIKNSSHLVLEQSKAVDQHPEHLSSIDDTYEMIGEWLNNNFKPEQFAKICYRVVHGGDYYSVPVQIDESVLKLLASLVPFAPLHQPTGLKAVTFFMKRFPNAQHIACFDTAFHRTMPKVAQTFALPARLRQQGIKPYGFHGLSYQYIAGKLAELNDGIVPARTIVAHLGSGASICALLNGKSIATSMSFTPLDGLPMSTRCGAIDASAVLYLVEQLKFTTSEVSNILNRESGLLGLSGLSGDVRELLKSKDENARSAMTFYIYRICREVGAMSATLAGVDALVFTGGVGSNNAQIRQNVCENFDWFGISIDQLANRRNENIISSTTSRVAVYSLKTDEEKMMATLVSE